MNISSEIQPVKYRRISDSERNLIIKLYEEGKRIKFISDMLDLKSATVNSVVQTYKKFGSIKRKRGHRKSKLNELQKNEMKSWLDENCQLTLEDLANRVEEKFQIKVSTTTVFSYLDKLHFSVKKISRVPLRRNCASTIETRFNYAKKFMERIDQSSTIFIDETGIALHCRSSYGRSEIGKRANVTVRAIRGKNYSVCCAMSRTGVEFYQAQEKSYNAIDFIDFIKQFLEYLPNGSVKKHYLIMDNVPFHHNNQIEEMILEKNHELIFLPPYSPFLNPIENLFNQFKFYVKRLSPSTADEVFNAIENASQVISAEDCENYWRNMLKYVSISLQKVSIEN